MERWLSGLYVAAVLALGLASLWPKLGVQFAPTEVRVPMRPAAPLAALPSPTATPPAPQAKAELPGAPASAQPKPSEPVASTPLSSEDLRPFKNLAVPASPKNSARTLTPGPVRPAVAKVNLNTASQAELESLPRVGPAMAKRIIQGRPYRNLEDLDKVKGVGPKMLEVLAPLVSF